MRNNKTKKMSFVTGLSILRQRWWIIVLCLAGFLIPILIYNQQATPVYRATTKIIFEENESLIESSDKGVLEKGNFIANQIEEMKTESFAREIHKNLSPETRQQFLLAHPNITSLRDAEFAVNEIRKQLTIKPTRETEVVDISFDSPQPELAKTIAAEAAQVMIQRNREVKRLKFNTVKGVADEQIEIVRKRLADADASLREYKERHNITSLESDTEEIQKRLTQAENLYNQVNSNKREVREKLNLIRSKLNTEKSQLTDNVVRTSTPKAALLKERLVKLEVQYSNLQIQGMPENHPKMREIRGEIRQLKENLVVEITKLKDNEDMETFVDPFSQMQKYQENAVALELELRALEAKDANLRSMISQYERKLRTLPQAEMTLVRLMRERESSHNMYMTLVQEREKARLNEAGQSGNIRIIEAAKFPTEPVFPRKAINIVVAIFSGLIIGIFLVSGIEYVNDAIKTEDDVEKTIGLQVIASIPRLKHSLPVHTNGKGNGNGHSLDKRAATDQAILLDEYNLLHFALMQKIKPPCSIMITSSIPREGKSTISSMLAITCAQRGVRTLLINGDLRRPTLHNIFNVPRKPGLTNIVLELRNILKKHRQYGVSNNSKVVLKTLLLENATQTFQKNLYLIPCGSLPSNSVRAWSSKAWPQIFSELKQLFDVIIVDAPPMIGIPDTVIMSHHIDHILYCVEANGINKRSLQRSFKLFKNAIRDSEKKLVGVILNKIDLISQYGKYKYYRYYTKEDRDYQVLESAEKEYKSSTPF